MAAAAAVACQNARAEVARNREVQRLQFERLQTEYDEAAETLRSSDRKRSVSARTPSVFSRAHQQARCQRTVAVVYHLLVRRSYTRGAHARSQAVRPALTGLVPCAAALRGRCWM